MNKSINLNDYNRDYFQKRYSKLLIKAPNDLHDGIYQQNDTTATLYKTGKLLFQGKNVNEFYEEIIFDVKRFEINTIGSDEVGVGDFFGPLMVCAVYLSKYNIHKVRKLGAGDSKTITDQKIRKIAPEIKSIVDYKVLGCDNKIYNQLTDAGLNAHAIKAWLHNEAINYLINKFKAPDFVIVDQFTSEQAYYKYFDEFKKAFPNKALTPIYRNIKFETKAESKFIAVACASIIARYEWLLSMDKLSELIGARVPFGTNDIVKDFALKVIRKKGEDFFTNNVKKHFKTYNELVG